MATFPCSRGVATQRAVTGGKMWSLHVLTMSGNLLTRTRETCAMLIEQPKLMILSGVSKAPSCYGTAPPVALSV